MTVLLNTRNGKAFCNGRRLLKMFEFELKQHGPGLSQEMNLN